jgi:hypothetical protein
MSLVVDHPTPRPGMEEQEEAEADPWTELLAPRSYWRDQVKTVVMESGDSEAIQIYVYMTCADDVQRVMRALLYLLLVLGQALGLILTRNAQQG